MRGQGRCPVRAASQFFLPLSYDFLASIHLHNMHHAHVSSWVTTRSIKLLGSSSQWDRRYLAISSWVLFWSSVNIPGTHFAETFDIHKMPVRNNCTAPKLMPTSLTMLHRSCLLSHIARVCTTLTFSSVVASPHTPSLPLLNSAYRDENFLITPLISNQNAPKEAIGSVIYFLLFNVVFSQNFASTKFRETLQQMQSFVKKKTFAKISKFTVTMVTRYIVITSFLQHPLPLILLVGHIFIIWVNVNMWPLLWHFGLLWNDKKTSLWYSEDCMPMTLLSTKAVARRIMTSHYSYLRPNKK